MDKYKRLVADVLGLADITIDGSRAWDPRIHDERFYRRVLADGSLGLGESYMDGWWDAPRLDQFFDRILRAHLDQRVDRWRTLVAHVKTRLFNLQSSARAWRVGHHHYDLGNDLFQVMLDRRLVYTCGYWENATNLDDAQAAKLDLVCRKIGLGEGMRVLDVGCGWGSFARFAAEHYGARVTGVTISAEQAALGRELCAGLPVDIRLQDYRDVSESYDRVVSLGMFEHVGARNYRTYMRVLRRCLADDGLFLLHSIGGNLTTPGCDAWTARYIFPNGQIPSLSQVGSACERAFVVEDMHNFGPDYDRTLLAWHRNFVKGWQRIAARYGERFYRMWTYYLQACAGAFRARDIQLWQFVLSKEGVHGGYRRPATLPSTGESAQLWPAASPPRAALH